MKILIIANYIDFPWENGNCRFIYLINMLSKYDIELITSNFCHTNKKKRTQNEVKKRTSYKITLIDEPGYKKNVSFKRLYSHKVLSHNLKKYLNKLNYTPNIIYCSIPSIDVAYTAIKFAKKNKIRYFLDIQDLWPESFKMALNIPLISNLIFLPMMVKVNYIYKNSDNIIAVSKTYVERALKVNKKLKSGLSVFLGTDLKFFDEFRKKYKQTYDDNLIRIVYIGTLGTSYDIKGVIDAIEILNGRKVNNIKFIVIGDGPLKESFEKYSREKKVFSDFIGRLSYPQMVGLLCSCDIAVNPIVGDSFASIINKVGDYAAAGLPVINTQNSDEYRNLIDEYHAGLNCENGNPVDIANKLEKLIKDKKLRLKYGKGNRILAEERFDRKATYKNIVKLLGENENEKI